MGQTIFPVPAAGKTYTVQTFLTSGSLTIPSTGVGFIDIFIQGGGGGGGKSMSGSQWGSRGGGPGEWGYASHINCPAGTTLTITVGGGGAGASTAANSDQWGTDGSTSSISGISGWWGSPTVAGGTGGSGNTAENASLSNYAWGSATLLNQVNTTVYAAYSVGPGSYTYVHSQGGGVGATGTRTLGAAHRFYNVNASDGAGYSETSMGVPPLITSALLTAASGSAGTNSTSNGGSSTANTNWAGSGGNGGKLTTAGGAGRGGGGGGGGGSNSAGTANGNGGAASTNSGAGGGGGGCGTSTLNTAGNGGNGGSGFVIIGYWS